MAVVISNQEIAPNIYRIEVGTSAEAILPGQFYMLRGWGDEPLFSRPFSICDAAEGRLIFVYEIKGRGTKLLKEMQAGDDITLLGPRGNGFETKGYQNVTLIGGGLGIAPLLYLAKTLKQNGVFITAYLGYRDVAFLKEDFAPWCDEIIVDIGGYITDKVMPTHEEAAYLCGPEVMMCKAAEKYRSHPHTDVWVSAERRMACGIGACLGCNIKTRSGNQKVCSDGPVFAAKELFYE